MPFETLNDWQATLGLDGESLAADPQFLDMDGPDGVLGSVRLTVREIIPDRGLGRCGLRRLRRPTPDGSGLPTAGQEGRCTGAP